MRPSLQWMPLPATFALALAFALTSATAAAGGSLEQAKQWYQEGDKAEGQGDCGTAIQRFRLALDVKETPQLHLRIGRCQDKLGALADAFDSYQRARALAADNEKIAGVVDEQLAALKPRVPRLSLVVKNPPPGLLVKLNGAAVTSFVEDRYINPGEAVVTASATGFQPFTAKMHLEAGDKRSLEVVLVPIAASDPKPPPKVEAPESTGPSPAAFVLIGLGAAGVGTGIGLTVHGVSLASELENPATYACTKAAGAANYTCKGNGDIVIDGKTAKQVQSQSNLFKGVGGATLGVGAAAATIGVVLVFVTKRSKPTTAPSVSALPMVSPGLAGLSVAGRF